MGFEANPVRVRARFDGHVFVPDVPLDVPPGTVLEGWTHPPQTSWPPGYIESTMGQWVGDDLEEPIDLPPDDVEPIS